MPKYHCLDTEVQLYTWSPELPLTTPPTSSGPFVAASVFDTWSNLTPSLRVVENPSSTNHAWVSSRDPAGTYKSTRLEEEFFRGYEGVDFLGSHTPFYIISTAKRVHDGTGLAVRQKTIPSSYPTHQQLDESQGTLTDSSLSDVDTDVLSDIHDTLDEVSMISTTYANAVDDTHPPVAASGSVIPSRSDEEPSATSSMGVDVPNFKELEGTDGLIVQGTALPLSRPFPPSTPRHADEGSIFGSRPIKIVVKLSDASFVKPFLGPDKNRCDICISIFFNGDFITSDIICYKRWAAESRTKSAHYSGKRVQPAEETPWIVELEPRRNASLLQHRGEEHRMLSPSERWMCLSERLLCEANMWKVGLSGCQTPTGTYLEQLSRKIMPCDANVFSNNSSFGVVDIVISHGSSIRRKVATSPDMLRRKLAQKMTRTDEDPTGKLAADKCSKFSEVVETKSSLNPSINLTKSISSGSVIDLEGTELCSVIPDSIPSLLLTPGQRSIGNSIKLLKAKSSKNVLHPRKSSADLAASVTTNILVAPPAKSYHPGRPKVVPQKRYRGTDPEPDSEGAMTRKKTSNQLGASLSTPVSMATRSRRNAGTLTNQTPQSSESIGPNINVITEFKDENVHKLGTGEQMKSLAAINPPEALKTGAPRLPKKDKVVPKTPRSGARLGRHGKPVKYNPKYSNRPQNLRRKNSSGEWETPTKPRWQVDAPTSAPKADISKTVDEFEKIFQPNFSVEGTKGRPATLDRLLMRDEMSMDGGFDLDLNAISTVLKSGPNETGPANETSASNGQTTLSGIITLLPDPKTCYESTVSAINAFVEIGDEEILDQTLMVQADTPKLRFMVPNHKFRASGEHMKFLMGTEGPNTEDDSQISISQGPGDGHENTRSMDGDMTSGMIKFEESSATARDQKRILVIGPGAAAPSKGEPQGKPSATVAGPDSPNHPRRLCSNELKAHSYARNRKGLASSSEGSMSAEMVTKLMTKARQKVIAYKAGQLAARTIKADIGTQKTPNGLLNWEASYRNSSHDPKLPIPMMGNSGERPQGPMAMVLGEASQVPAEIEGPTGKKTAWKKKRTLPRRLNGKWAAPDPGIDVESKSSILGVKSNISEIQAHKNMVKKAMRKPLQFPGKSSIAGSSDPVATMDSTGPILDTPDLVQKIDAQPTRSIQYTPNQVQKTEPKRRTHSALGQPQKTDSQLPVDYSAINSQLSSAPTPVEPNMKGPAIINGIGTTKSSKAGTIIATDKGKITVEDDTKFMTSEKKRTQTDADTNEPSTTEPKIIEYSRTTTVPSKTPSLSEYSQLPPLCKSPVLTYATTQTWPGLEAQPVTGQMLRTVPADNDDDYFEAAGIVLGVRYVFGV